MGKRLVVCCDGTWNSPDQDAPTNVTKLALAVARRDEAGVEQRVFYHVGVGVKRSERLRGGAFGRGLGRDVRDCYRFLVESFEPDDELFLFGFSRGAFTARSTAGLVRNCGILRRQHLDRLGEAYALYRSRGGHPRGMQAELFRRSFSHEPRIHFIGVWDTVGALGIPLDRLRFLNPFIWRDQFHDTDLSTKVDYAYQALAIDEKRWLFPPAMWTRRPDASKEQTLEQVWFAGVHGDVGGGYPDPALAEIALLWMVDRARSGGLAFDPRYFSKVPPPPVHLEDARAAGRYVAPAPDGCLHESRTGFYRLLPRHIRRPGTEPGPDGEVAFGQSVSSSARRRLRTGVYAPPHLAQYIDADGAVTEI